MGKALKVIEYREIMRVKDTKNGKYVLAYLTNKDEWATWATDDAIESFFWGHYFKDKAGAEEDFLIRGEEPVESEA